MYELTFLTERAGFLESPAKIGLVRVGEKEVCLIDSGGDKDAGRKVRQLLDREGWSLTAIYNTHSNADHIGGNRYLQGQTGCPIYAPGMECDFTNHPVLEPSLLYGGYPPKELRHKFLMAQESDARPLTPQALPEGMTILPLPGHFLDMVGFRTKDGVAYLADCLSSPETLEKYQIGFIYDVGAYLETLEMVKTLEAEWFVPSHAPAVQDIGPLAEYNIGKVHRVADDLLALCREPLPFEEVLHRVFRDYQLTMTFEQYALVGSTVRSYLAWLHDTGRMEAFFEDDRLLWRTICG